MHDMLRPTVEHHRDYWRGYLTFVETVILGHLSPGDPGRRDAELLVSFCREMLSVSERWLEQTRLEAM